MKARVLKVEVKYPNGRWRELGTIVTPSLAARAGVMRRHAYVDPKLLRTAEIRALEQPS